MCSFSWRDFGDHIGVAFNRDERKTRAKAHIPKKFGIKSKQYIMPIDPDAGGTWISVNQAGFVFALLNNYQGKVKPESDDLNSRGEIVKTLSLCENLKQIQLVKEQLQLAKYQPFSLVIISKQFKSMWEYDGLTEQLVTSELPNHYFSSAHPEAPRVLAERLVTANAWSIDCEDDLLQLHRSHVPNNAESIEEDRTFSICMHHSKGHTQSLTYVRLEDSKAVMKYWDGQPCETNLFSEISLSLI